VWAGGSGDSQYCVATGQRHSDQLNRTGERKRQRKHFVFQVIKCAIKLVRKLQLCHCYKLFIYYIEH
jgi:hypothetical protein